MRSILFALALAAPVSAVASTKTPAPAPAPNYTNPMSTVHHHANEQAVFLTFVNFTSQEREVRIGNYQYAMRPNTVFHTLVPVGSVVRVYSNENSKVNGQELLQVSTSDANKSVFLK